LHRADKLAPLLRFDEKAGFEHEGLKPAAAKIARELRRSRGSAPPRATCVCITFKRHEL